MCVFIVSNYPITLISDVGKLNEALYLWKKGYLSKGLIIDYLLLFRWKNLWYFHDVGWSMFNI